MKRRWRRIVTVAGLLLCLYIAYRLTLHFMVEAKLDEIRKQGYPVTLAELDKWYPNVPKDANAAEIYEEAFSKYGKWDYDKIHTLPVVGDAKLPKRGDSLSNDVQGALATYLAENQQALKLLHDGETRTRSRYPVTYSEGLETPVPHVNGVRQGARLLCLEAFANADKGDSQAACDSILSGVALTRSLESEPDGISQLVRMAVLGINATSLENSLNRVSFTDDQMGKIGDAFAAFELTNALERAFAGDLTMRTDFFRASVNRQLEQMLPPPPPPHGFFNGVGFLPRSWYRQPQFHFLKISGLMEMDELRFLDIMQAYLLAMRLPLLERLSAAKAIDNRMHKLPKFCVVSRWLTCGGSGLSALVAKDLDAIARSRCCYVALAVERYRVANGALPDFVADLAPEFVEGVPVDPFVGQPLRYQRLVKGYVVYSVGENGKDDGGDGTASAQTNWRPRDITFTVER